MPYTITKNPDGDVNIGNLSGEIVTLQPANSDYPLNGYPIISQDAANMQTPPAPNTVNCDLWKIVTALPIGGQGGYSPVWNPSTQKLEIFQDSSAQGPGGRVTTGTDLSKFAFQLLLLGY